MRGRFEIHTKKEQQLYISECVSCLYKNKKFAVDL